MASTHSKELEIYNAKQFKEAVSEPSSSNLYLTFGRVKPWPDENNPIQANTSVASFYEVWKNMIGGKRITGNDMRHVIPRHDWVYGDTYIAYDHQIDSIVLKNPNTAFYVVTDDWNVYKCLANNNGEPSYVKPTSLNTLIPFQTTDKYIWKYMYTIDKEEQLRFTTSEFIPVKTLTLNDNSQQWLVQENAIDGGLHVINLTANGSGYTSNNINVVIRGDGTITANAVAIRDILTNTISEIVIDDPGVGYSYADILIDSTNGSGAMARSVISPVGGHGSDPITELGGSFLLINVQLENSELGILTTHNDFRQIAVIEDPIYRASGNIASNSVFSQLTELTLNGTSVEYIEDEDVYQGGAYFNASFRGTIVEWNSANNVMKLTDTSGTPANELIVGTESTAARFLDSVAYPDFRPYTGKLLYIDNIKPIERADDQTETFQLIFKF
jgi:hypothetical protein